ncbi:carbohydrate kinase [Agrobacterium rhizogenes]|uniref:FGGY-family carbohydrate kinase n=1 Tax=Rhizobium rhizogenes TaxID=359 RepID=UPI00080FB14F|nr:FGGY-family carbohydrate kinase [Rhizobium rhizogenes]NTI44822.1 carbohydrate kinase [Rhizobium rhizogenes]NTI64904.1 carbohydrate kinase [Rhizobium rhizogenes]OCJ23576.1 carbohydrate kinase [Agrobacterium sp. B131/95]
MTDHRQSYRRIVVLDIGKTNAKVVVLDAHSGAEIAAVRTTNTVLKTGPYPHYDIERLWDFVIGALKGFATTPGFDAISITTHGASAVLLAADGGLALPVLDYEHVYPDAVQQAYERLRPPFSETFSPKLSGGLNVGAQIHCQKSQFPDDFARVRAILTYPQYWAFRLTGVAANEVTSLGCHTDLWNPTAGAYSSLVDTLGIRPLMASIRSAFDALGPILPRIATEIGIDTPVPVYCGIHDSNASLLPHLVENEVPFAVVSTGTWVISFAVGGDLEHLDPTRDALANVDAYGRAVPSSRFMGGREFEILAGEIGQADPNAIGASLETVIGKGIMLLPNVVEGSGPFPGKKIRWIGDVSASPAERLAAASLYLALMTEACLGLIGAKGPIFVEGPFALNRAYLAALSSLTGSDVVALPGSTGTSQGAALLTGIRPAAATASQPIRAELLGLQDYREAWHTALGDG